MCDIYYSLIRRVTYTWYFLETTENQKGLNKVNTESKIYSVEN